LTEPRLTPEQAGAARAERGPAVVSAAAGSGKTRVLTERFGHLVRESGVAVDSIAAVTFTERAAGEMRRRVARLFGEAGMEAERRSALRSHISTIHGLASSILREYPALAGVDPRFTILDETASRVHLRRIAAELLEENDVFAPLLAKRTAAEVEEAARRLMDHERARGREARDILAECDDPEGYLQRTLGALAERVAPLMSGLRRIADELDPSALSDAMARKAAGFRELVASVPAGETPGRGLVEEMRDQVKGSRKTSALGRGKALIDEHRDFIPDEAVERRLARERLLVTRLAGEMLLRYGQAKARRGEIDYEDQLILARNLLRDNGFIRSEYRARFRELMVDEYQDTNPLQTEILGHLAPPERLFVVGDPKQSIYGFRNARPEIFVRAEESAAAGDGALHRLAGNFRSVPGIIDFVNEFFGRLELSNESGAIRCERAPETFPPCDGPAVEILLLERPELPSASAPGPSAPSAPPERAGRWAGSFAEADALAGRIRGLVEGGAQVHDRETGNIRPARWGDFGILVRTRGEAFKAIELAFGRSGVPLSASGGTHFFERREITDLLALLAVVENPTRDIALAAVLRSPLVELSDDALVLAAAAARSASASARPKWRKRTPIYYGLLDAVRRDALPPRDLERATRFLEMRDELSAPHLGAGDILREAMRRTAYDAKTLARGRAGRELANAWKLVSAAERFDRTSGGGLGAFREYVRELRFVERIEPAQHELESSDSVKLLTMHAAKGLEFPVVCVADLGYNFLGSTQRQSSYATDELGITLRDVDEYGTKPKRRAPSQELSRALHVERARAEEARLLYVAMTRARDRLVLSGVMPPPTKGGPPAAPGPRSARSMLDWVRFAAGDDARRAGEVVKLGEAEALVAAAGAAGARLGTSDRVADLATDCRPGEIITPPAKLKPAKKDSAAASAAAKRAKTRPAPAPGPALLQATALRDFATSPELYWRRHVLGLADAQPERPSTQPERPSERAARGTGTAFGEAVHRALESADFRAEPGAESRRLSERFLTVALGPSRAELARGEVERFLGTETAARIGRAEWVGREVPVSVTVGGTLLDGVADVVWRDAAGAWGVVDYKTDVGEPAELAREYRLQLGVYALAVARFAGKPAVEASLHFLSAGEAVELGLSADEIEAEIADALGRLALFEFGPSD